MEQAIKMLEQNSHVWFKEDDIYDYLQRKFSNLDIYELYVKYVLYCDIVHCKPLVNNPELLYKIFHDKFSVEYKEYARKLKDYILQMRYLLQKIKLIYLFQQLYPT